MDTLTPALFNWLVDEAPVHHSLDELRRLFGNDGDEVQVALDGLIGDGLAHRNGEFYFASRAAVRAEALRF